MSGDVRRPVVCSLARLVCSGTPLLASSQRVGASGRVWRYWPLVESCIKVDPFQFQHSYQQASAQFAHHCAPTPVAAPALITWNAPLAEELGLAALGSVPASQLAAWFSGNQMLDSARPAALAYAGHQFGSFAPQLGDGRAVLLGEVVDPRGRRYDVQLKGAGRTPFSRGGDGRAALGPVLREYLLAESMAALGVPTTRALACVRTGETVYRQTALPGAVLTRVAASHIRVGTFEYFAARDDRQSLARLADYVIERHFPAAADAPEPLLALLDAVCRVQADLVAHWMSIGFIHGVMNTDNVAISGETIDYGPCAFMDSYHPETVFSSIDREGRYAWQMQPAVCQWNMARFAECLLPLLVPALGEAQAVAAVTEQVQAFLSHYERAWLARMGGKLGLAISCAADGPLIDDLLSLMAAHKVDFTLLFASLADSQSGPVEQTPAAALFADGAGWAAWAARWRQRLAAEPGDAAQTGKRMRSRNPLVIARNHRVEAAITRAIEADDFSLFERLLKGLSTPFTADVEMRDWLAPPAENAAVYQTFCGT